jgi:7,8-dihydropterin-6-yl-methyl-4-(beta-D-ribofuranosyl)aminobenzene 5'-phosphate synthase
MLNFRGRSCATSLIWPAVLALVAGAGAATAAQGAAVLRAAAAATGEIRLTIVYDNEAHDRRLQAAPGFALLVEHGREPLLFDTGGDGPRLLANLRAVGMEPAGIRRVVLSHIHGDHTNGLAGLLAAGGRPAVYVLPTFPENFKRRIRSMASLVEVTPGHPIAPGVATTGEIPGTPPEQALLIESALGIAVITGCAHPGIVEILELVRARTGQPVRLVLGGFHLADKDDAYIQNVVSAFRRLGVERVVPTHCTGARAVARFAAEYGADFTRGGAGRVILLPPSP